VLSLKDEGVVAVSMTLFGAKALKLNYRLTSSESSSVLYSSSICSAWSTWVTSAKMKADILGLGALGSSMVPD
jgi:hypothetical protein